MKKLLLLILVLPTIASAAWWNPVSWFQSNEPKVGAPILSFQPSLIPITDSLFDLGTTTKAWRQGWFDELCLTADTCKTAWPTGGGGSGGGTWSTTTSQVAGRLINYPNNTTDIVVVGSNASTTAEYWFDPNTLTSFLSGKVGIGTTSPYAPLSVVGEIVGAYFTGTTTATSTLAGGLQTNLLRVTSATASSTFSNGIDLTAGCFSINGTCVGGGGTGASTTLLADTNTWSGGNIFANTTTTNATSTSQAITNTSSALLQVDANGSVGEYAGTSCTNQFVRSLSALGVATCATVGASDVSLANLTATDSTLTFSGTYNGATARTIGLNLGNANTWTVNQTFNYSSSTAYSSFRTASTTNLIVNGENFSDLTGTGLAISGGALVTSNIPNASLQNSTISGVALGSNLNSLSNDATLLGTSYNGSAAVSDWGIDLSNPNTWTGLQQFQGKASSTLLSVYNGLYVGTTGTTTILGTATSTFGAGVEATYLNITGTSATSTFARGINLAGGCFAINGTCIGGSGSSASTTLLSDSNTFSGLNAFTNSGTTSFTGGIATTRIDTSATSTLAGLRIDSGGLQISTLNCSGLANGGTLTTDASGNVTCADDDGGAGGGANSKWASSTGPFTNAIYPNATGGNTLVGIGTSTPIYQLTIASSTASQIGLTDGSLTSNQFGIRNAGGIFYVASSSPLTGATSSPLFTINGTTGDVSFGSGTTGISLNPIGDSYFTNRLAVGTTTQYSKLTVWGGTTGNIFEAVTNASSSALTVSATGFGTTTLSGLSISGLATSTSNVGFNLTGGCFALNGTCISGGSGSAPTTVTEIGYPVVGVISTTAITFTTTSDTNMRCGLIYLRGNMTVNKVSVRTGTVSVAGTADITLYSEDGQTQLFSVTTANMSSANTVYTTAVSSVAVTAGNYYLCVNTNSSATNLQLHGWNISAVPFGDTAGLTNDVTSEPRSQGTTTITSATPAGTINPTTLTDVNTTIVIVRFDN